MDFLCVQFQFTTKQDGKLVKFEKYINDNKVMNFVYEHDERGNLIKIYKNNIEVRKLL